MKNLLSKKLGLLLPLALALTGCSSNSQNPEPSSAAVPEEMEVSESHDTGLPFDFEVEPEAGYAEEQYYDGFHLDVERGLPEFTRALFGAKEA